MTAITENQWIHAIYNLADVGYLDPVHIAYSTEKKMIDALRTYNQTANNKFITGLIDCYDESGTLSEKQWYYLVRMYLKLDEVMIDLRDTGKAVDNQRQLAINSFKKVN
jgi:hypothetical protein